MEVWLHVLGEVIGIGDQVGDRELWYFDSPGSGGKAGSGGNVKISSQALIFAYNGDMVTNGNYSDVYYEYDKYGTKTENQLSVISKVNGSIFIPCKIFAQSGIARETYTTNQGEYSLNKIQRILEDDENNYQVPNSWENVKVIKATNEHNIATTGYINGYMSNQGIGSGAGYLEISNGTFTVDPSMN